MGFKCNYCPKVFTIKTNRSRHERNFHAVEKELPVFTCYHCNFSTLLLSKLQQHIESDHQKFNNICRYCRLGFCELKDFKDHMQSEHGLPVLDQQLTSLSNPSSSITQASDIDNFPASIEVHESAMKNTLMTFIIPNQNIEHDLIEFMTLKKNEIQSLILDRTCNGPCKVQFSAKLTLIKHATVVSDQSVQQPEDERVEIFANSMMTPLYANGLSDELFLEMLGKMETGFQNFSAHGSGWVLQRVNELYIKIGKMLPIRGSSFIPLPAKIANSQQLINIRNHNDHNCFLLCYTAAYHLRYKPDLIVGRLVDPKLEETDPHTYTKPGTHQASDDFVMPMSLNMIPQFERLNNVQVNVFQYQKGDLIPMIVSKFESSDNFIMDLLLLYEPGMHHFVLIKDLLRFVCEVRKQKFRSFLQLCRNCFQIHYNEIDHKTHERLCKDHEPAVVIMPTAENGCHKFKFKNFQALWYAPIVVYFDFESFLNPVTTCMNNPQISSSRVLEKHEPSGSSMVAIDHESSEPFFFSLDSSENCLENFIKELHLLARDVYIYKRKVPHYLGDRSQLRKEETLTCWICQENFSESEEKCLDHCHSSGKFLGWTHDKCNLARRNINYIPVVGHNLQNYDMHHICLALNECDSRSTIQVIPSTDEKYISLFIGVVVKTITRKDETTQNIYEYLRFIDSFKFLNSSLQKLVDNFPDNKFTILENHFQNVSQTCRTLIRRKGFYPYNYMTDRKKFDEKELPPLEKWVNSLDGDKIAISADNLVEAKEVFNQFNCQNLRDYHDLYLSCDTLLLACVFEEFRSISYETYSLDCAHHFTASNLSGDAFKRVCKADVELLTDRDHLDMVEKMMRGGTASIFEKRQFTANNRQMYETFKSSEDTIYDFMVDANNLYGGVMQTHKLPARHFETIGVRNERNNQENEDENSMSIDEILATPDNSDYGYIVEIDLKYPQLLHESHRDYPLAPTKEVVQKDWLSRYQTNISDQMKNNENCGPTIGKVKKLLQTLHDKTHYIIHYKLLKLYVKLGLIVTKTVSHRKVQTRIVARTVHNSKYKQTKSGKKQV